MVDLSLVNPIVGMRDWFARRSDAPSSNASSSNASSSDASSSYVSSSDPSTVKKDPLTSFPSPEELREYPSPVSFVVQGMICDQIQSPLFGRIPAEIRNEIFRLALTEYIPEGNEWTGKLSEVKSPGFGNVYEETKLLPLLDLEVCLYMAHKQRAPKPYTMSQYMGTQTYTHPRTSWFKPEHWARVHNYHVFGQMYLLEQGFRNLFRNRLDICLPSSMTLTLRYTDWWNWEVNAPIFPIQHHLFFPLRDIELPSTVQKMTVEFENIEPKIKQLDAVIGEMFHRRDYWVWKRRDGRKLTVRGKGVEGDGIKTWTWTGPTTFGYRSQKFPHHAKGDTMEYVVKVVTWEVAEDADVEDADGVHFEELEASASSRGRGKRGEIVNIGVVDDKCQRCTRTRIQDTLSIG
ncbi:uncharacterized protein N0V89_003017 [Didymosphaeria variabile]|uniref:Uncharacterized protein n=1 Tax=Didymosphaeria variabile TaxID=1932322 RepID=A0A9W9CF38_9PLEO|nr:uncharacterized protein N0V89_003017 [Didymosphaeria variabile]KAJ4358434.1 hypothetical protein N0V89_003017 [Didymosphaeria variabile]